MHRALRPVEPADAEWICAACQDSSIQRWTTVPRPYTLDHAEAFVRDAAFADVFVITSDGRGVGVISIHSIDAATGDAEVGYWIAEGARGQGLATWAMNALAEFARDHRRATSMSAVIADANIASRGVARGADLAPVPGDESATDNGQPTAATRWRRSLS